MPAAATTASVHRSGIRTAFELANATPGTIHLELGEPDFPTPAHVVEAADAAARAGRTGYTSNLGIPELRAALATKLRTRNGIEATADQVVVTHGATQGLLAVLRALVDPGDGVLVPDPGWPNYRSMTEAVHGTVQPYALRPEAGYVPRVADVERALTPRSRVLLLNSPSNPLGSMLDEATLAELVELARAHDLWVVGDECYEDIAFGGPVPVTARFDADERVVSVFSFSKSYAMTGWRVGYVHAPGRLAPLLSGLQEPLVSCVNTPAQHAALAALTGPQDVVARMRDSYRDRRDAALAVLADAGIPALRPAGAFYLWVDVSAAGLPSAEVARDLVVERRVAAVAGEAFGPSGQGALRISLATAVDDLLEGCRRIGERVNELAAALPVR
ncbi:MAG: pyridoxal phosphate-dependent aminotransferase [Acidimicrobiia bacterium]